MTRKPTVVIVDDAADLRAVVRARLTISGLFDVIDEAGDGNEAWVLADGLQPDLMLLDTSMPEMDGLEALSLIRAVAPDTKVVIFTGFGEAGLADQARALGASDFVEKSLPIGELPGRLWKVLHDGTVPMPGAALRAASGDDEDAVVAQVALDEHLERYREVFSQAAIGMATLTLNGSIVRANDALADLLACTPDQLIGLDYGVLTEGGGDDFDAALRTLHDDHARLATVEHRSTRADGTDRTLRLTLVPVLDSQERPLYVFAQVQDITADVELRRSEEMFRLLVSAVKEYAIYMLDTDGRVATWNAGAQHIKGWTNEEVIGQHFRIFYPPAERAQRHPEHNLELALAHGSHAEDGWRVRRDGSRFWAGVVITAVYDAQGRHIGFAKVTCDKSQQLNHEEERRLAVEQQAHLLAVTAHELRTPTAVIDGSIAMLREHAEDQSPEERDQLLEALASSAQRLRRLVADLATASDLHADALDLQPEQVRLRGLLMSAAERLRAAHRSARVNVEVPVDIDLTVDPSRIGQALDNLLENAIKHGRAPTRIVGEPTADGVRIVVTDDGPGVEPRLVKRLFERFAHAGPNAGTGLGLHLVREIAQSHGGSADYRSPSADERGAFVVELPRMPRPPEV
ncbi:PAS domain S-box protein [Nocardioides montaniterrae]